MTKRLIGVGVGPGDPELVTVKAVRVLREADVVLVPVLAADPQTPQAPARRPAGLSTADPAGPSTAIPAEPGRAETIIRAYVGADRVKRLEFALNDTGGVTPRRAAAWQAAAAAVANEFAAGAATIAFGTLGDPNLYSTFSYLAQTVRDLVPEVTVETVAGITAMQDLASRAGISLAEGTEPVTLVPLNGGADALDQALACGGTVVGYKVGAAASPAPAVLRDRLHAAGRLDGAVIGARLGLEGELIAPAAEILRPPRPPPKPPPSRPKPPHSRPSPRRRSPARHQRHSGHSVFVYPDRPCPPPTHHRCRPPSCRSRAREQQRWSIDVAGATSMEHRCRYVRGRSEAKGRRGRQAGRRRKPCGAGGVRGSRSWGPGPADPARGAGHSDRRRGDLGVEPGRPASAGARPAKRRNRGLGQAPDGGRAALLRARGAAETKSRPRPLR